MVPLLPIGNYMWNTGWVFGEALEYCFMITEVELGGEALVQINQFQVQLDISSIVWCTHNCSEVRLD